MKLRLNILLVPMLLFIVSQVISICGAFDALSLLDTDGIDDMSLEDIVFIDPFLHSHVQAKTELGATEAEISTKSTTKVFYVDEIIKCNPQDLLVASTMKGDWNPPPNLWLTNRVLRI